MMSLDSDLVKNLIDCEFMECIPTDVRNLIANVRIKFCAFKEEVSRERKETSRVLMLDHQKLFDELYDKTAREDRMRALPPDKQMLVAKLKSELIGMVPYEWGNKKEPQVQVSKNQRRKDNRLKNKNKAKKSKKRGGQKKKTEEEIPAHIKYDSDGSLEEEEEEEPNFDEEEPNVEEMNDSERQEYYYKEAIKIAAPHLCASSKKFEPGSKKEWEYRRANKLPYMPWELEHKSKKITSKLKKLKSATDEERKQTDIDYTEADRKELALFTGYTQDLANALRDFDDALIDLVKHPLFTDRQSVCEHFSSTMEELTESYGEKNVDRMRGIANLFALPTDDLLNEYTDSVVTSRADRDFSVTLQKKRQDESSNLDIPSMDEPETYAKVFNKLLQRKDPEDQIRIYTMGEKLNDEKDKYNILKQKTVEHCFHFALKVMKEAKPSFELYMSILIFKLTMGLPIGRKYCWKDPEFFPMLVKLLETKDETADMDCNQIRSDTAHVVYISLLAATRDVYVIAREAKLLECFVNILAEEPTNFRDAQAGEDIILTITMMTDHWDVFEDEMRKLNILNVIKEWRKYALNYSVMLKQFICNIEFLVLRLKILLKSDEIKRRKPKFRLEESKVVTEGRSFIKGFNRTICSNPSCLKMNVDDNDRYKKCSKCSLSFYCCKDCQLTHWTTHKKWCKRPTWEKPSKSTNETDEITVVQRKLANILPQESTNTYLVPDSLSKE